MMRSLAMCFLLLIAAGCSRSDDDLIKDLSSPESHVRRAAASKLIMRSGDKELAGKLVSLLDSSDEQVIFIATQILGSLADTLAVEPLGKLVEHQNPAIRSRACWSLGSIGHYSALPFLLKALEDKDDNVRYSAVVALGHLHYVPAVEHIYPMFRDPVDSVRVRAIQSIYYYRLDEGAHILAADFSPVLIDKSERVRYVAVQALGGAWEDARGWVYQDSTVAGELLVEALKDENKYVRIETINSLKRLKYANAVPELKKMYELATVDEEVAISEAVKAITGEDYPPQSATQEKKQE